MKESPISDEELREAAIEFLSECDVDFGYATGNLNMDTTQASRKRLIDVSVKMLKFVAQKKYQEGELNGRIDERVKFRGELWRYYTGGPLYEENDECIENLESQLERKEQ